MNKKQDEAGFISWGDVGQLWRDTEREYGVHVTVGGRWTYNRRRDLGVYLSFSAYQVGAERSDIVLCQSGFIYPDVAFRTVPGACVASLHRVCATLERQRSETDVLAQAAFFPADA